LGRLLAVAAVALQMLLPGSMAVAGANGGDLSRLMCAPSGEISAETRAAAARLAELTGEEGPQEAPSDVHCALCTPPGATGPNDPAQLAVPCVFAIELALTADLPGLVHRAQGPPLGARAPPPQS
jgi:hypothetical protein